MCPCVVCPIALIRNTNTNNYSYNNNGNIHPILKNIFPPSKSTLMKSDEFRKPSLLHEE